MRIISYNLRKHRAVSELGDLVEAHDPDVLVRVDIIAPTPESLSGFAADFGLPQTAVEDAPKPAHSRTIPGTT